jgi:glyoxylase-like metal-dependent hydrolase (beta-lactamase superfamily II)
VVELETGRSPVSVLCEGYDAGRAAAHMPWLAPHHLELATGTAFLSYHTWLIAAGDRKILIDPCIGNHKPRPALPEYDMLDTPWLDRLAAPGALPHEIDLVVCTHLHVDHCGWNTRLENGQWVPTFPNAEYVVSKREYHFWDDDARSAAPDPAVRFNEGVFADSVAPVMARGQMKLVADDADLGAGLCLIPTPGHTIGHVCARFQDDGEGVLFAGDAIHHPLHVLFPEWNILGSWDLEAAFRSRLAILDHCVATGDLLAPAHFRAPHAARVSGSREQGYTLHWI